MGRDSRERVLTTQEQRRALLQVIENSGLSGPQFGSGPQRSGSEPRSSWMRIWVSQGLEPSYDLASVGCSQPYQSFAQSLQCGDNIHLAGCWAHVRRKFYEAMEHSGDARQVMGMIQQLYAVEEELRQARAGPDERRKQRQQRNRPLMESLKQQLQQRQQSRAHLPQSSMGKALSYTLKQWEYLWRSLEDRLLEMDNNLVENAIRPSAIGKKNWLFIGESEAGVRAATFYTLVGNCQQLSVDAYAYLLELFTKLPTMTNHQVQGITPQAWAQQKDSDSVKAST